jgi:hypothetical protein
MPAPATGPVPAKADSFLLSCIDPRLTDDTTFHLAALGRTDRYSEMRIAGAALALVDQARPAWQATIWDNLAASRKLHGIRNVTLMNHRDCGAMDLWAGRRLADDPVKELRVHTEVLNAAADAIRARHPDLLIEIKLMDLDGTVTRPECRSCVPTGFRLGTVLQDGVPVLEPAPPPHTATLARLRRSRGALNAEAEFALLERAITEDGLTLAEAEAAIADPASPRPRVARQDVLIYLRARADRRGQVDHPSIAEAAGLYRRLQGPGVTLREAEQAVAAIASEAGFMPRPSGLWPFRSTRWFDRMAA